MSTAATEAPDADRTILLAAIAIAGCAAVFAGAAFLAASPRFALGVAAGGVIALANFIVLARIGRALSGGRRRALVWVVVYLVKVAALFGGTALLLHSGVVGAGGVVVGFAALVPGIVVGALLAVPRDPDVAPPTQ